MTRQEFLQKHWSKYPQLSPAVKNAGRQGRVVAIDSQKVHLQSSQDIFLIRPSEGHSLLGHELGLECPLSALVLGDIVHLESNSDGSSRLYLLSPCLSLDPPQFLKTDWSFFLQATAEFFLSQGFVQWTTPTLVTSPGVDAHIDFMTVQSVRTQRSFCLPTSPEIELKKAIVQGVETLFEIKSCFRDDDKSPLHKPEFKMLEWYRSYANKWELVDDITKLISFLYQKMNLRRQVQIEKKSMRELFQTYVGLDLTPTTSCQELQQQLQNFRLDWSEHDDWDDLFFRLYIEKVEPHLGLINPLVVYDFPPSQSSIASLTSEGWSDRFELYWKGVELANAYQEQNDPALIRDKVNREVLKRKELLRVPQPVDEEFLALMEKGFPPCAGCALGLDRLFMVIHEQKTIYSNRL